MIGWPTSDSFWIGNCELRVAPLNTSRTYSPNSSVDMLAAGQWGFPDGTWQAVTPNLFSHIAGSVDPLTYSGTYLNIGLDRAYKIVCNVSASPSGSVNVTVGGYTKNIVTDDFTEEFIAESTDGLVVTPTSDFIGIISVQLYSLSADSDSWLLDPIHSIGLFENAVLTMGHISTKSNAGFPRSSEQDKATLAQMSISGRLREYTSKNIALFSGKGASQASDSAIEFGLPPNSPLVTVELVTERLDGTLVYHDIWKAEIVDAAAAIPISPTEFSGTELRINSRPILLDDYYDANRPLFYFRSKLATSPVGRVNYIPPPPAQETVIE